MDNELPELDWNTLVKLASNIELDADVERMFQFAHDITIQEPEFLKLVALWVQNGAHLISQNPLGITNILASIANMGFTFGMIYAQNQKGMLESWSSFWDKFPDEEENNDEPAQSEDNKDN